MTIDLEDSFDRATADLEACDENWSSAGLDKEGCFNAYVCHLAACLASNNASDEVVDNVLLKILGDIKIFRGLCEDEN